MKEAAFANSEAVIFLKTDGTVSLRSINLNPPEAEFVAGLRDITSVQFSGGYFVALDRNGELVAWRPQNLDRPRVYRGPSMIKAIAGSSYNVLVLRSNGTVAVWDPEASTVADVVPTLNEVDAIAGGYPTHLALKRDGTVVAIKAELPDWLEDSRHVDPVPEDLADVIAIYSKSAQAAIMRSGQLIVWGESRLSFDFYQLPEIPQRL